MKNYPDTLITLYRIGAGYWAECTEGGNLDDLRVWIVDVADSTSDEVTIEVGGDILKMLPRAPVEKDEKYLLYRSPKVMSIALPQRAILGVRSPTDPSFELTANLEAERFRRKRWQNFLSVMFHPEASVESVLIAAMKLTFSDHYSLWLYNELAQKFHRHSSSFDSECEVIDESDDRNTLLKFLTSKAPWEHRTLNGGAVNSERLAEAKSLNRFSIDVGFPAVLTFYSTRADFEFSERARAILPRMLTTALYGEISPVYIKKSRKIRDITSRYELGKFSEFLGELLRRATYELGWESGSIFIKDDTGGVARLKLRASISSGKVVRPEPLPEYDLNSSSLTGKVYIENKPIAVYDLPTNPGNSHVYDETTTNAPTNWVGVPIGQFNKDPVGVLRVKNRIEEGVIVPPNVLDIRLLESIAAVVAYLLGLDDLYEERRREIQEQLVETTEENRNLSEFIKTFRHELKSPLTILTQAANTIQRRLTQEGLIKKDKPLPRKLQLALDDLDAVGSRLALVTNYLTFDAHELVREQRRVRVFHEVIAPVCTFATEYARRRKRSIDISHDTLTGYTAICDPDAAGMVFHMILDNAIKYSDQNTVIGISGNVTSSFVGVRISSRGIIIREEEAPNVFEKYFRGAEARSQKIEGSGIGLYLAREIMKLNSGDIVLVRRADPVIFEIRFKSLN